MSKYKAIVVDDDSNIRNIVVEFLEKMEIQARAYETATD